MPYLYHKETASALQHGAHLISVEIQDVQKEIDILQRKQEYLRQLERELTDLWRAEV